MARKHVDKDWWCDCGSVNLDAPDECDALGAFLGSSPPCRATTRTGPAERRREDRGALCRNAPPKPNSKCRLADAPPDRRHTTPQGERE